MKKFIVILIIFGGIFILFLVWFLSGDNKGTENCDLIKKGDSFERVIELLGEPEKRYKEVFSYPTQPLESMNSTITFSELNLVLTKHCVDGGSF
jgi:hypothetical protein